jgi:hypothetical protein
MFILEFIGILSVLGLPTVVPLINNYYEGNYCINSIAQVGDTVQTKDSLMTVVEIHRESIFCRKPDLPIRAQLQTQK